MYLVDRAKDECRWVFCLCYVLWVMCRKYNLLRLSKFWIKIIRDLRFVTLKNAPKSIGGTMILMKPYPGKPWQIHNYYEFLISARQTYNWSAPEESGGRCLADPSHNFGNLIRGVIVFYGTFRPQLYSSTDSLILQQKVMKLAKFLQNAQLYLQLSNQYRKRKR